MKGPDLTSCVGEGGGVPPFGSMMGDEPGLICPRDRDRGGAGQGQSNSWGLGFWEEQG